MEADARQVQPWGYFPVQVGFLSEGRSNALLYRLTECETMRLEKHIPLARARIACLVLLGAMHWCGPSAAQPATEPDYRTAVGWWRELPKKWTPVGWKNHLFRFNVLFNGALVADPHVNRRTKAWASAGLLLWPSWADPVDDGTVRQGWSGEHETPLLWTEWGGSPLAAAQAPGVVLRQEVFAHVPGGSPVKTGREPLFAWVRLSVSPLKGKDAASGRCKLGYRVFGPAIGRSMQLEKNLIYQWQPYPRELLFQPADAETPFVRLREPDGKIRLAVADQQGCRIAMVKGEKHPTLGIEFEVGQGGHLDLVVPMIPVTAKAAERECRLGFTKALAESDAYWGQVPETAASIEVPEEPISRAIAQHLKMAEVIAETDPATGDCALLTGSWQYAKIWATPNAMTVAWLLDPLGYHAQAERYLAVFKKYQGTTVPPGKAYKPHAGYLGTPRAYQAINWISDNGALLWAMAQHGLLTGDKDFIENYMPTILKSCQWIREARALRGHGGIEGILPPGIATDEKKEVQSVWNDGWNYKGLCTAVRLLKRLGHPQAQEFATEAQDYRRRFGEVIRRLVQETPTWKDASGRERHLVPRHLWGDKDWGTSHAFYLDAGPLFLVFAGLMDADDELMENCRLFFREGPNRWAYTDDGYPWKSPSLYHEMSSCEPCYSWVFFHTWQLGDRSHFLEGMYSLFAGACSQQTFTVCETRGGITGLTPCLGNAWLARLAVIDDQLRDEELHLLRLVPLAWLRSDREARFHNMPTEFGPVTVSFRLKNEAKRELDVHFVPRFHTRPRRIVLHVPPIAALAGIALNGKPLAWKPGTTTVELR